MSLFCMCVYICILCIFVFCMYVSGDVFICRTARVYIRCANIDAALASALKRTLRSHVHTRTGLNVVKFTYAIYAEMRVCTQVAMWPQAFVLP